MATTRTRATAPEVSNWTDNQSVSKNSFVTVWQTPDALAKPVAFTKAVFQLNTNKMYMRVRVLEEDGITEHTKLDVDLETINGDMKLFKSTGISFPIMQYDSPNLWIYEPSDALLIGSGDKVVIELKAKSNGKKVSYGMSEWGTI